MAVSHTTQLTSIADPAFAYNISNDAHHEGYTLMWSACAPSHLQAHSGHRRAALSIDLAQPPQREQMAAESSMETRDPLARLCMRMHHGQ